MNLKQISDNLKKVKDGDQKYSISSFQNNDGSSYLEIFVYKRKVAGFNLSNKGKKWRQYYGNPDLLTYAKSLFDSTDETIDESWKLTESKYIKDLKESLEKDDPVGDNYYTVSSYWDKESSSTVCKVKKGEEVLGSFDWVGKKVLGGEDLPDKVKLAIAEAAEDSKNSDKVGSFTGFLELKLNDK